MRFQAPKRNINFCPMCGLIADHNAKGDYCECPHCEIWFHVFVKGLTADMIGPQRRAISCANKVRHATLQSAWDTWLEIKDRLIHSGSEMTVYQCDICGEFHLGHKPAKKSEFYTRRVWGMSQVEDLMREQIVECKQQ